ncbi:PepSY domain-containing protein [Mammaliicoccus vitulinus]|uniref:PepSY domain-containing protein n=1 Tax=Mammaliicoccus vitulinus TaxID=71237 RepID=UPI003B9E9BD9
MKWDDVKVSPEEAVKVAQNEDYGKLVYSIDLKEVNKDTTEFKINAKSKEILEQD